MNAFLDQIPSEAKMRAELRKIIYGSHLFCPRCHGRRVYASEGRYRCRDCRRPFDLLSGTWLRGMRIRLRTLYVLLWCWTQKVPVLQSQKLCGLSEKCVRRYFQEFRAHMPESEAILEGRVQMDEAYFRSLSLLMAKQKGTRNLVYQVIYNSSINKTEAMRFLFQAVAPHSTLQTDGSSIYKRSERSWPVTHRVDIHARFEFGLTSEIEGTFGNLRTFIRRMYHHVTAEHLPELVAEFATRFSHPELFESPYGYLAKSISSVPTR